MPEKRGYMEHLEITNPAFLAPGVIAFGLDYADGKWIGRIAWADYETAEVRASNRDACLALTRWCVRAR